MKLTHLAYLGLGYVLGARAGRQRYEQIVSVTRRVAGSQTVQASAGVATAQVDEVAARARKRLRDRLA